MIVLLIIFMVTVPLIARGRCTCRPPQIRRRVTRRTQLSCWRSTRRGQLSIDGTMVGDVTAALREVAERVGADPVRPVQIKADRDVSYRTVAVVLDACRGAGAEVLSLATERPAVR